MGWGRLLTAVIDTDPIVTGASVERVTERVEPVEHDERMELSRTVVPDPANDVYA